MVQSRIKDLTLKSVDDESTGFSFTGYLSTFGNTDRDGDVIEAKAFDAWVKEHPVVPMLFNHDRNKVMGKLSLSVDDKGLRVVGEFNEADSEAVNVHALIKMGALDSMSVGMAIKDYEPLDPDRPFGGWLIKQADVYEGSVVTIPANGEALIDNVKSLDDGERQELEALRLEKRRAEILGGFN